MVRKALIILPVMVAVLGVGAAFAHGWFSNSYGAQAVSSGDFWTSMLEHHKIMHNDPDATLEEVQAFHEQMHGSGGCGGGCGNFNQESNFTGCPMRSQFGA